MANNEEVLGADSEAEPVLGKPGEIVTLGNGKQVTLGSDGRPLTTASGEIRYWSDDPLGESDGDE